MFLGFYKLLFFPHINLVLITCVQVFILFKLIQFTIQYKFNISNITLICIPHNRHYLWVKFMVFPFSESVINTNWPKPVMNLFIWLKCLKLTFQNQSENLFLISIHDRTCMFLIIFKFKAICQVSYIFLSEFFFVLYYLYVFDIFYKFVNIWNSASINRLLNYGRKFGYTHLLD